ncbi:family 20 glycosylhydrolase [Paenibacillus herberti]|uniref:Uncharacterized protein n=1 Tax=Paenibacillus herberti TaxID=1619309 RepID=A0A229NXK2_9BACL|nr:family 20 glycosylhydrolase [Paenibacillus herberti]OXM14662.1 hypothetical protein CGZ75_17270 [Paenibacillus herberti]
MSKTGWDEQGLPLLPMPKHAHRLDGVLKPAGKRLEVCVNPALAWLGEVISEEWTVRFGGEMDIRIGEEDDWQIRIGSVDEGNVEHADRVGHDDITQVSSSHVDESGQPLGEAEAPPEVGGGLPSSEAYQLRIDSSGIRIEATGYRGALYGWFTLSQWLHAHQGDAIPGLDVSDAPELELRGFHFDLKGSVPNLEYMLGAIERLASFKINTLLVEYEDQFEFVGLPDIHKPGGLSAGDRDVLLAHARRYGMEMMPVVQCLGHVDYILKHERYEHLSEDGLLSQFCPAMPETLALVTAMIDEIAAAHPDAVYIHIGADETLALGRCEHCRERMGGGNKADLYLEYVSKVADYVLSIGKKPVVWDDMFHLERCIERVIELPKGTAICSWSYYEFGEPSNWFWYGGGYYSSQNWENRDPGAVPAGPNLEGLPEEDQAVVRQYWDEGQYPDFGGSAVPWVRHYMEQGYEVIGVSCARGADFINQWSAYPADRVANVKFWAGHAAKRGMTGTIASAWTRFYSLSPPIEHWETGWYPTVAQAAYSWNPSMDEFERLFRSVFLEGDAEISQAMDWIQAAWDTREENNMGRKRAYYQASVRKLEPFAGRTDPLGRYAEGLLLSALYEDSVLALESGLRQNEWRMYGQLDKGPTDRDYMAHRDWNGLCKAADQAVRWEERALAYCNAFMPRDEAGELVESKLHAYRARIRLLSRTLGRDCTI